MNKKYLHLFSLLFISIFLLNSIEDHLEKKYSFSVFSGGRERITFENPEQKKFLSINYVNTKVDIYENYSKVKINYIIYNSSRASSINYTFSYPKIDTFITKSTEQISQKDFSRISSSIKSDVKFGNYNDFKVTINGVKENYIIEDGKILERIIPFRVGDKKIFLENENVKVVEDINSFFYMYGWYHISAQTNKRKKTFIQISYSVPHYQNEISVKSNSNLNLYDPALDYDYVIYDGIKKSNSEKIFSYYNSTSYKFDILPIKKAIFKIESHIINDDFIEIYPRKYRKKRDTFSFRFSNLKPDPVNNIFIKIFEPNSRRTINSLYFKTEPLKQKREYSSYFTIDKNNNTIKLFYQSQNKESLSSLLPKNSHIEVSEIRILPRIYTKKESVTEFNLPLKFEISFSLNNDFSDSKTYQTEIKLKDYYSLISKKNYLTIFNETPIETKNIMIKILQSSLNDDDYIQINDIEILR